MCDMNDRRKQFTALIFGGESFTQEIGGTLS